MSEGWPSKEAEEIARALHELMLSRGHDMPPWRKMTEDERRESIELVQELIDNRQITPGSRHAPLPRY